MTHTAALVTAAVLLVGLAAAAPARALEVGKAAPLFEAESSTGKIALADFQGKKNVLLAFYFADFTGG
jgi:peroxiredoxin Q/BCP